MVRGSAHDERDFAFAKKYSIPLKEVLEPVFRQTKGEDKIRETLPFIHRDAVVCLVKHWTENKYLCLKWKKTDWTGFVVGGIEKGEDAVVAGIREIKEETGYSNVRFVKKLGGTIHSLFFHPLKKENRLAHFQGLYFELTESKREEISEEEKNIHDVHWISADKVKEFLNVDDMKLFWERCNGIEKPWMNIQDSVLMEPSAFAGKIASEFREEISIYLEKNKLARKKTTYKLRDWVFSRQRYWGEPIPIIHCLACGVVPVPEKNLPVKLPQVSHYEPTGTGESPLAAIEAWVNVKCPRCKGHAKRETNTMPQWAGSSWYFLRFEDPKNKKMLVDSTKEKYWSPVDMYVGGAEHATRHLIYARFWYKFLNDIGVVDYNEPFKRLKHVGLIMAPDGKKMSKRYGNVINPDHIVATWGADTLRLYEMFMGPFSQSVSWSTESIIGSRRFIEKVWRLQGACDVKAIVTPEIESLLDKTVKKVTEDIEEFRFNTAISQMMIFVNKLEALPIISQKTYETFLQILAPFAPHVSEEIWHALGHKTSIHIEPWPLTHAARREETSSRLVLQVNGKVRGILDIPTDSSEKDIETMVLNTPVLEKWLKGESVKKVIIVKGKVANVVLNVPQ